MGSGNLNLLFLGPRAGPRAAEVATGAHGELGAAMVVAARAGHASCAGAASDDCGSEALWCTGTGPIPRRRPARQCLRRRTSISLGVLGCLFG